MPTVSSLSCFGSLRPALRGRAFSARPTRGCMPSGCPRTAGSPLGWAVQKGSELVALHASSFGHSQPVQQLVRTGNFFRNSMGTAMEQLQLRLLGRLDGPSVAPAHAVVAIRSYREAVRTCWVLRRCKGLTITDLARDHGFTRQHASDYLNTDDKPGRRDLPPDMIQAFEDVCGNVVISQWLAHRAHLTILEEMQADRLGRAA